MRDGPDPDRWPRLLRGAWWLSVAATALNGIVVGYGAVWFQLFGESAGRADYLVGAGGYGAAAVVLAAALLSAPSRHGRLALAGLAGALGVAGAWSLSRARALPPESAFSGPLDGAGGVLLLPWSWLLLALAARDARRRLRRSSVG